MGSSERKGKVASMYAVDEDGRAIPGTVITAKQKESTSSHHKSRSEDKRKTKSDTSTDQQRALMSGAIPNHMVSERELKLERRKTSASTKSPSKSHSRPPSAHGNKPSLRVSPPRTDHPSHFGIATGTRQPPVISQYPQVSQPIPLRPRAFTAQTYPRPVSYHAPYAGAGYAPGPPLSVSAYYNQQTLLPTPSYPPPSPSSSFMRYAATPQPQPQNGYFAPRPLAQRFGAGAGAGADPIMRTSSAFGPRDPPVHQQIQDAYEEGYASASEEKQRRRTSLQPSRRTSLSRKVEVDYDRAAMPPPPRPILRNRAATEYHTETVTSEPIYRDVRPSHRERDRSSSRRPPSKHRYSGAYSPSPEPEHERERAHIETANTSHRRRQSYYSQPSATSVPTYQNPKTPMHQNPPPPPPKYEEAVNLAANYQDSVSGPPIPLTAEALRRRSRHAGSSRSTKSSTSRDESDYRKSATTRTTRSGSGQEDEYTIKVSGMARVCVGGAQIDTDGGEIEIKRNKSLRGSERGSEYGGPGRIEERSSRGERGQGRSRRESVSGASYGGRTPHYAGREGFF